MSSTQHTVTQLLRQWKAGDERAIEALFPLVYQELRRLARRHMAHERPDHTLRHTALVHEAYVRLVEMDVAFNDRAHFFAVASRAMRCILVDYARARTSAKRGGGAVAAPLEELPAPAAVGANTDLLAVDEALTRLAARDTRQGGILEMRYFGGLTVDEIAQVLSVSPATVDRDLKLAKEWMGRELGLTA